MLTDATVLVPVAIVVIVVTMFWVRRRRRDVPIRGTGALAARTVVVPIILTFVAARRADSIADWSIWIAIVFGVWALTLPLLKRVAS